MNEAAILSAILNICIALLVGFDPSPGTVQQLGTALAPREPGFSGEPLPQPANPPMARGPWGPASPGPAAPGTPAPGADSSLLTPADSTSGTLSQADSSDPAAAVFRVLATAEGLIGGTTALGHTIGKWSEGAALPSRSALNRSLGVTYLANGRQAACQVLDVGPWNTNDPYWETPGSHPQAESGFDTRGRRTNGAGIDLFSATWYKLLALSAYDKHLLENVSGEVEWSFTP